MPRLKMVTLRIRYSLGYFMCLVWSMSAHGDFILQLREDGIETERRFWIITA